MIEGDTRQAQMLGTHAHKLRSHFYDVEHQIFIFLPPHFDARSGMTYPVLYVTDGNWLFWSVASAMLLYSEARAVEDVIVVGISEGTQLANVEASRGYRFTPQPHPLIPEGGGADLFCHFCTEQLFPFIEQTYPARSGDRGVIGFSLGGLWASYAMAQHPELFQRYVIVSPPVGYAGEQIYTGLEQLRASSTNLAVYAAISEHDYHDCRISWKPWIDALSPERSPSIQLSYEEFSGEYHDSVAIPAILRGIQHLYRRLDFSPPLGPG